MATNPINYGGAPVTMSGAVIRLPTAAARTVRQNHNRGARAAKAQLPRHPAEFMSPGQRTAARLARDLASIGKPSVEMELLTSILAALDDDARAKVLDVLAPRVVTGWRSAEVALAVFRATRMTVGEALDLDNAMRQLRGGEA